MNQFHTGNTIRAISNLLRHRGLDDEGYIAISTRDRVVTPLGGADSQIPLPDISLFGGNSDLYLAHRRLSIIDLTPAGHQPMSFDDGNLWVTYNGELYNYLDLRAELEKRGHIFQTRTDTEVLLASYREWGEDCLDRFDGMWSFVIYDMRRNLLFGSCDRFGVKPLYYLKNDVLFAFASEAKAFEAIPGFKRTARSEAVFDYLAFGVERWDNGATFLEGVMELPPAHAFRFNIAEKSLCVRRYYTLPYNDERSCEPYCETKAIKHVEQVRELVLAAVRKHLISDVPVGSCLSGGIDSSSIFGIIGAILEKERIAEVGDRPRAFTACYEDATIDESAWARLAAEHTGGVWHTVCPQGDELIKDLEDLVYTQDFPFGGTSIYAQYRVMKLAKEHGMKVLLDGQGGDELFTGYTPYYTYFFREMLENAAWRDLAREWSAMENAPLSRKTLCGNLLKSMLKQRMSNSMKRSAYSNRSPLWSSLSPDLIKTSFPERVDHFIESLPSSISLNENLFSMMNGSLPRLLRYEDRNSMRFQIESRTPFSDDRNLIESVFSIPAPYKIHNGYSKWLLRESMRSVLPNEIRLRRDKKGFETPEKNWMLRNIDSLNKRVGENLSPFLRAEMLKGTAMKDLLNMDVSSAWRVVNLAVWVGQTESKNIRQE